MIKNTYPGLFINFEGLDGSGALIQASLLSAVLSKEGYRTFLTKEPTNYLTGGLIRGFLTKEWKATPECQQLLFAADRAQHLDKDIVPKLASGRIVITDRYTYSSIAYGSLFTDHRWIEKINERFITPDLTFLIKVRPKICALRMKESDYSLELFHEEQKLIKVWKIYERLNKKYKSFHIINGEQEETEIIKEILGITRKTLGASAKERKK